ncbi:ADP-ribosylglycohydrolase family protein [Microcoleus sp. FACHB-672]|uniref:ADP-ribosylglycohydrolase family protein n=1 Tax=Microcoleus sp. FACHB-672 TaxID=2692825 RepID=UPI001684EC35|nr:ADP-ribosylglycohydrolase family protein [Microcoleus sp. FACHB-672]MBD2039387.1 ADP-ribosylglycohydrolase family protein [Microcoleus sp. FACHB-672]
MSLPRPEQFSGCLIGQCLGDATGCRVEGYAPEACQNYVKYELSIKQPGERDRFPYPFGQYTDDSQLARELLQSYVTCGRFDPDDYACRIAAIFTENRIVGRGRATEKAALRLAQGVPWQDAGTPAPDAGNGSAMRAAPIGLIFCDDPQQMIQAAHDQGRITHQDVRCSAGAVAVAGAVALGLQGSSMEPKPFLSQLSQWVSEIDLTFAASIKELILWIPQPPAEAVKFVSTAGLPTDYTSDWRGISPFVVGSVLWSLYSFLKTPANYWQTICTAIAVGGDVDTTAAMAGAMSGAYLGLAAIPQELGSRLNDRGSWRYAELVELANKCYQLKNTDS